MDTDSKLIDWNQGGTIVAILTVVFVIFFGVPMFVSHAEILLTTSMLFYIILFMIGAFGHYDDFVKPRLTKDDIIGTLAGALLGYLVIQVMFLFGLTMLRTPTATILTVLNRTEAILFNIAFVVPGEELIYRDTLPWILWIVFTNVRIKGESLSDQNSVIFAFLISSVAFGLSHFFAYQFDPIALLQAVVAGIVLSLVRIKFGIGASYGAHGLFNVLNLLGLFVLPFVVT